MAKIEVDSDHTDHIKWRFDRYLEYLNNPFCNKPFLIGQMNEIQDQFDYMIRPDLVAESPQKERFCN